MRQILVTQMNLAHLHGDHAIIISGSDGTGYCLRRYHGEQAPQGSRYPTISLFGQDITDLAAGRSVTAIPVALDGSAQDRVLVRLFADVAEFRQSIEDHAGRLGFDLPREYTVIPDKDITEWISPVADMYGPTS